MSPTRYHLRNKKHQPMLGQNEYSFPYCPRRYLLIWDDAEWNSVKDWIRLAKVAVRRSHREHGDIGLVPRPKVLPKS
jgi:hypothetical protein